MKSPRIVALGVATLPLLVGTAIVLRDRELGGGPRVSSLPTAVSFAATPGDFAEALREAGFPEELVARIAPIKGEVVGHDPGHIRVRQVQPDSPTERRSEIRLTQVTFRVPPEAAMLRTASGIGFHPMSLRVAKHPAGVVQSYAFYIPPDELSPADRSALGPLPRVSSPARGATHAISVDASQPGLLAEGAVADVASGSSGTFIPGGQAQTAIPQGAQPGAQAGVARPGAPAPVELDWPANQGGFWENEMCWNESFDRSAQSVRDRDFGKRGTAWQENELRLARERAAAQRLAAAPALVFAAWEAFDGMLTHWEVGDSVPPSNSAIGTRPTRSRKTRSGVTRGTVSSVMRSSMHAMMSIKWPPSTSPTRSTTLPRERSGVPLVPDSPLGDPVPTRCSTTSSGFATVKSREA